MEVELRDLSNSPVRITSRARGVLKKIYVKLKEISEDPEKHGKLQALVTYDLTNPQLREKGKAAVLATEVRREFGHYPSVAGFRFLVCRSDDLTEEYLATIYKPEWVVPGEWDRHVARESARRREKYQRAKDRKAERDRRNGSSRSNNQGEMRNQ